MRSRTSNKHGGQVWTRFVRSCSCQERRKHHWSASANREDRHLAEFGGHTPRYCTAYRRGNLSHSKPSGWIEEVKHLSSIAVTQPHAAYAAFTHGLASRWTYLSRTIPNIEDMMKPLETTIRQHFLPSLTGQNPFNDQYRDLLALPARLGGLGITNPSKQTTSHFDASKKITAPLVALITQQSHSYPLEAKAKQARAKRNIHILHRQQDETAAADLKSTLSSKPKSAMEASSEKGASSWLSTLPIAEHGFALHKGEFRDALCLRYG